MPGTASGRIKEIAEFALIPLLAYVVFSFVWSLLGFASPVPPAHLREYTLGTFAVEVGGHLLFGAVAALPTMDLRLIALCTGEASLIDSDHILSALNFPVETRLSHSIGFLILMTVAISWVATRGKRLDVRVMLTTVAAILAHFSYDIYAGNGEFPVFAPVSLTPVQFPHWTWAVFEASAIAVASLVLAMKWRKGASLRHRIPPGGAPAPTPTSPDPPKTLRLA